MSKNQWKCFGCFQVQSITLLIGLWHLAVHLLGFILFISAFYLTADYCQAASVYNAGRSSDVSHDSVYSYSLPEHWFKGRGNGVKLWAFMSILSLAAVALLIRGVLKKTSALILPFFFLQLFDLLFDLTIIFVYILLSSDVHEFFSQLYRPPYHRFLVNFTYYQRTIFASFYVVTSLLAKVYLMYVVYSCYQFLLVPRKADREKNLLFGEHRNSNEMIVRQDETEVIPRREIIS